jgi:hypothetical protein
MIIPFEFGRNLKQDDFHDKVMLSVARQRPYRHLFYGGAIRGGKTFICLYIIWRLANIFPNSRWHIIREDNPSLESTTIPSMEKLIGNDGPTFVWKRQSGNRHILLYNHSKIFFQYENINHDPELTKFLGLETNGVLLEQMESLSERLYLRTIERIGSWVIDPMPIPLLLGTFNPTQTWVKRIIYDRYIKDELKENEHFQEALPSDNPFVTKEQWENWDNLDEESKNIMIRGIWTFSQDGRKFAYSFKYDQHIKNKDLPEMQIKKDLPLYLVFDFNVDPITCLICQKGKGHEWGKVINELRIRTSDIYELLERVTTLYPDFYYIVTGDASGRNRTAITKGNKSYVQIIQSELGLSGLQMQFPSANPSIRNTRILMNSIFNKHKNFFISSACLFLIDDLETVKTDEKGNLDKKTDTLKTHLLDNLRYFEWNYFRTWLNVKF